MKQLISERTHILEQCSSCRDAFFNNQSNILMDAGLGSPLHLKCHNQIIYRKLNLKIEYSSPYIREIWNYNRAETNLINRTIKKCDCPSLFLGKKFLGRNIFYNYIPNKIILCDGKDPPLINEKTKSLIHRKNALYQRQRKSGSIDYTSLNALKLEDYKFFQIEIPGTSC